MATRQFDNDNFVVNLQGRDIDDWGTTDPPFVAEDIDDTNTLNRGFGGNAANFRRSNPGMRFTMNLTPGSPQSAYLSGLYRANTIVRGGYVNVGTLEAGAGFEGIITRRPNTGRGGPGLADDTWVVEFNRSERNYGGEI